MPQQQLAQIIGPNGQIQLAQIQQAQPTTTQGGTTNWTQNANGTITIQVQQFPLVFVKLEASWNLRNGLVIT